MFARIACAAALLIAGGTAARADSMALWTIVHTQCVPSQARSGRPAPCARVAPSYAVLKDRVGIAQLLLIPTTRLNGIESPALLAANAPNYWAAAWNARTLLAQHLPAMPPRSAIGLAINSAAARSQNQLHIHIDCVRPDVTAALHDHQSAIGPEWSTLTLPPANHPYKVRRVAGHDLDHIHPFALVARQGPDVRGNMAMQTIAVIGSTFDDGTDGFYVLTRRADLAAADPAFGEELLDHDCRAVTQAP